MVGRYSLPIPFWKSVQEISTGRSDLVSFIYIVIFVRNKSYWNGPVVFDDVQITAHLF